MPAIRIMDQAGTPGTRALHWNSRRRSQGACLFVVELPREAFGVRPACWRCGKARGGSKAGASSTHSKRFAQFGSRFVTLRDSAALV